MDPFFFLELALEATGEEVEARYRELVRQYPPDRAPEQFAAIREAHESLVGEERRLEARFLELDEHGRALIDDRPLWRRGRPRPRLSTEEMSRVARRAAQHRERSRGRQ